MRQLQAQAEEAAAAREEVRSAADAAAADSAALLRTLRQQLDDAHTSAAEHAKQLQELAARAEVCLHAFDWLPVLDEPVSGWPSSECNKFLGLQIVCKHHSDQAWRLVGLKRND